MVCVYVYVDCGAERRKTEYALLKIPLAFTGGVELG